MSTKVKRGTFLSNMDLLNQSKMEKKSNYKQNTKPFNSIIINKCKLQKWTFENAMRKLTNWDLFEQV